MQSRNDCSSKLLSRAYADVSTKYGDFCLHVEEEYVDYKTGAYRSISLYHGNHEQVIIPNLNEFDFHKFCLFRCKYIEKSKFNQWILGYVNENFDGPKRNIWNYGDAKYQEQKIDCPVYAFDLRTNTRGGVIFTNGSLKINENTICMPEFFENIETDEYEKLECTSKAYFSRHGEFLAIIKQGTKIIIEYNEKKYRTDKWSKPFSESIISLTDKEFTCDDFRKIITILEKMPINEREKKFVVDELITYMNIHNENEFSTINRFTLEPFKFDDIVEYIKSQDLTDLVEKFIELLSNNFHIDIEDLLGENPPNQQKNNGYVKKYKKNHES